MTKIHLLLMTIGMFNCLATNGESITCNGADPCSIDCTTENCQYSTIDTVDVDSVTINCGTSHACSNAKIYCPLSNTSSCIIHCHGDQSCAFLTVYANITENIAINCMGGNTANTNIYPCYAQTIYAQNAGSITYNGSASTFDAPGDYTPIYAYYAEEVNILCHAIRACYALDVYANFSGSAVLFSDSPAAWWSSKLMVSSSEDVSITCSGKPEEIILDSTTYGQLGPCHNGRYYLSNNASNTKINCYGSGCYTFGRIYVANSVQKLDVSIYGACDDCIDLGSCVPEHSIKIRCNYTINEPLYFPNGLSDTWSGIDRCGSNNCGCSQMSQSLSFINNDLNENGNCPTNAPTRDPTKYPTKYPTKIETTTPTIAPTIDQSQGDGSAIINIKNVFILCIILGMLCK